MSVHCRITMHCLCPAYKPSNEGSLTLSADDFHSYMDAECQQRCTQSLHPQCRIGVWECMDSTRTCMLIVSSFAHSPLIPSVSNQCFRMHWRHLRRAAELPASLGLLCCCSTGCINSVTATGREISPKAWKKVIFPNIYLLRLVDRQR